MNRVKHVNRLFLVMILISIASPFLFGRIFERLTFYQNSAVSEALFLLPVLGYIALNGGLCLNDLQLKMPRITVLLLVMVFTWLLMPLMTCLNLLSMLFAENHVAAELLGLQEMEVGKNLFYIAVVPALAEEFMFRGILYHGYRAAGIKKAILFSGLCFGLMHMNLNQFCYAFVIGMIFALLVEATGSVLCSMLAHFLMNANSVILLAFEKELENMMGSAAENLSAGAVQEVSQALSRQAILSTLGFYAVEAVICGFMAYGIFRLIIRLSGRKEYMKQIFEKKEAPAEETPSDRRIVTPAFAVAAAGAVGYMVIVEFLL